MSQVESPTYQQRAGATFSCSAASSSKIRRRLGVLDVAAICDPWLVRQLQRGNRGTHLLRSA